MSEKSPTKYKSTTGKHPLAGKKPSRRECVEFSIQEDAKEQAAAEARALKRATDAHDLSVLWATFASAKIEFSDLDGQRWDPNDPRLVASKQTQQDAITQRASLNPVANIHFVLESAAASAGPSGSSNVNLDSTKTTKGGIHPLQRHHGKKPRSRHVPVPDYFEDEIVSVLTYQESTGSRARSDDDDVNEKENKAKYKSNLSLRRRVSSRCLNFGSGTTRRSDEDTTDKDPGAPKALMEAAQIKGRGSRSLKRTLTYTSLNTSPVLAPTPFSIANNTLSSHFYTQSEASVAASMKTRGSRCLKRESTFTSLDPSPVFSPTPISVSSGGSSYNWLFNDDDEPEITTKASHSLQRASTFTNLNAGPVLSPTTFSIAAGSASSSSTAATPVNQGRRTLQGRYSFTNLTPSLPSTPTEGGGASYTNTEVDDWSLEERDGDVPFQPLEFELEFDSDNEDKLEDDDETTKASPASASRTLRYALSR